MSMSGPIVRKYGFPNFEKIFGERELQHGVEEGGEESPTEALPAETPPAPENANTPASLAKEATHSIKKKS